MSPSRRNILSAASLLAFDALAHASAPRTTTRLRAAMRHCRFVSYQPTGIKVFDGKLTPAADGSIAADLKVLRQWFDALITYSLANGAERVPDIAARMGYRAIIVGIFDIHDETEIANAIATIRRNNKIVVGCGVGNETVLSGRGSWHDLVRTIKVVRNAGSVAVSTTEPFANYLDHKESTLALAQMDFMLANVHPIFESWFRSGTSNNWAEFVSSVLDRLHALTPAQSL